jgi:hypothetical protein
MSSIKFLYIKNPHRHHSEYGFSHSLAHKRESERACCPTPYRWLPANIIVLYAAESTVLQYTRVGRAHAVVLNNPYSPE